MEATTFRSQVLKSGVMIALINIVITIVLYAVDPTILGSFSLLLGMMVLNFVLVTYAAIVLRRMNEGILSFKNAFVFIFLAVAVSAFINQGFSLLLFHVIDPELIQIVVNASIENTIALMERLGAPAEEMDKAMKTAKEEALANFTVSKQMMQMVWMILGSGIIYGLIGGAIAMKKPSIES